MVGEDTQQSSDSVRLERIEREIKTIGDRSTWLLGFLTIIIAGLTSFIFQGLNIAIAENDFPFLKPAVLGLFIHYLAITLFVLFVQMVGFLVIAEKNEAEVNEKKLKIMRFAYRFAIIFAIISLFGVCGFVIHFLYG